MSAARVDARRRKKGSLKTVFWFRRCREKSSASRATRPVFRADSTHVSRFSDRGVARTFAALLAAFFSCFSRSTAAMISICVKGRFSRFFALPLFRRPSPNATECW